MRKRNVYLAWISGFLIFALLLLLLSSYALLWGRLFVPSMPNSHLTSLWRLIRENRHITTIMNFLRHMSAYEAVCSAARDSEGKMEPLMYIIELMGSTGVAMGIINEVKSTRSFGMLMSDVIYYVFPYHLIIQAPLYMLFVVTGCYSCLKNVGIAASFCLLGIFVCFIYSVIMICCLSVSSRAKEKLVIFFIKGVIVDEFNKHKDTEDWRKTVSLFVLDYAKYIGQQWSKGNILQIQRDGKWEQEKMLINLASFSLTSDSNQLNEKLTPDVSKFELRIPKDFEKIFTIQMQGEQIDAKYILFTKLIPFMKQEIVDSLEIDIRRCSQIWEQLLSQIESQKHQAEIAYALLWIANSSGSQIFTLLSMGLLEYLGIAKCKNADSNIGQSIEQKITFLHNIHMSASETIPEENLSKPYDFNDNWAEIMYLAAGALQWMVSMNCINEDDGKSHVRHLLYAVQENMTDKGFINLTKSCDMYHVLSFLLFLFDNLDIREEMSAFMIQQLMPVVQKRLKTFEKRGGL